MRIDFVSDVACPWCAIGLNALERALAELGDALGAVELHMQPFELNPSMPAEGADATSYMLAKYGMSADQLAANRAAIVERGAQEGFTFGERTHVWNTFDAHRVLYWAGVEGPNGSQRTLKHALLEAYHGQGRNPAAHDVLLELAGDLDLPVARVRNVLERGEFADEVRAAERYWRELGITGVPATVVERRHLISGGQPSSAFKQALLQIATAADRDDQG